MNFFLMFVDIFRHKDILLEVFLLIEQHVDCGAITAGLTAQVLGLLKSHWIGLTDNVTITMANILDNSLGEVS